MNVNQAISSGTNQRRELAQVACPQRESQCGATLAAEATGTPRVETVTTLPAGAKCTWVAWAYALAPTFRVSAGLAAGWEIHTMEYVTKDAAWDAAVGALKEGTLTSGFRATGAATTPTTFVPLFDMPAAAFASLRTWYGAGALAGSGAPANWFAPGRLAIKTKASGAGSFTSTYPDAA